MILPDICRLSQGVLRSILILIEQAGSRAENEEKDNGRNTPRGGF